MIVLEIDRVELDHCPACKGVWLDSGELEIILENQPLPHIAAETDSAEEKVRCPKCRKKMAKVRFENSEVIIDSCPSSHGLWFDGGEIESLLKAQQIDPENRIYKHLWGIFRK